MILKIKQSKKYKGISEEIIKKHLDKIILLGKIKDPDSIIKETKTSLHQSYGSFQNQKTKKRQRILEDLKKSKGFFNNIGLHNKILSTNKSSLERLGQYAYFYEELFKIIKIPSSIVDIGCGLNPLSLPYTKLNPNDISYSAYDINEIDLNILKEYFELIKKDYSGFSYLIGILDAADIKSISSLPVADVCFMFKVLDPIEKSFGKGHKLAESIIRTTLEKYDYMVISFSTKTLSGKNMNFPRRGWIERMFERIQISYKTIRLKNEIFYVINKCP